MIALLAFFVPPRVHGARAGRAPSRGGRDLRLDARRVRRVRRLHDRLDVLVQQPRVLPGTALLRRRERAVHRGTRGQAWANNATYFIAASLLGLAVAFGLNVVGLDVGKRLHNAGAFGTWLPIAILIVAGAIALARFGSATPFTVESMMPTARLQRPRLLVDDRLRLRRRRGRVADGRGDPRRRARRARAILVAGAIITAVYPLGTIAVLVALPHGEVSGLSGIMQAIDRTSRRGRAPRRHADRRAAPDRRRSRLDRGVARVDGAAAVRQPASIARCPGRSARSTRSGERRTWRSRSRPRAPPRSSSSGRPVAR